MRAGLCPTARHIGVEHAIGDTAQRRLEQFDVIGRQQDEHGLPRVDAVPYERRKPVDEFVRAREEQRLVPKQGGGDHRPGFYPVTALRDREFVRA